MFRSDENDDDNSLDTKAEIILPPISHIGQRYAIGKNYMHAIQSRTNFNPTFYC